MMASEISSKSFYHVHRALPYNENAAFSVGQVLKIGEVHNPFFAYYKNAVTYPVNTPTGMVNCKAMAFLGGVLRREIQPGNFPQIAYDVAQHYLLLARELIMEEVRKQEALDAPSRQTCLWVVESLEAAQYWQRRLGSPLQGQLKISEATQ